MLKPIQLLILPIFFISPSVSSDVEKINQASFLGLPVLKTDVNKVRDQLWDIGGFVQARSTKQKRSVDIFFMSYRLKDSYKIEFTYRSAGDLLSIRRLYLPQSIFHKNKRTYIQTREIANDLSEQLGKPTKIRRVSGNSRAYSAYEWETDKLKITLDREGSEYLGNIFVSYQVKKDPYFVPPKKDDQVDA